MRGGGRGRGVTGLERLTNIHDAITFNGGETEEERTGERKWERARKLN